MRQGTVHAPAAQGVRVTLGQVADFLVADVGSPQACIGEEEALFGSESFLHGQRSVLRRSLKCLEGDVQTAVVGDVLTQRELAVGFQVGEDIDFVEEVDHHLRACLKLLGVVCAPPVSEVSILGELAALVVKSVGHLVSDDDAYRSVVVRIVSRHVEEGRLEDTGREADFVGRRVVVGIDSLRGHLPLVSVDGLAILVSNHLAPCEHVGTLCIHPETGLLVDDEVGVVCPLVGITDFDIEGVELFDGLCLGAVAHPVLHLDALLQRGLQVLHQRGHALFGLSREVFLHVHLSQRFAEAAFDGVDSAFPAGRTLLLSGHDATEEVELFLPDFVAQAAGCAVDELPGHVSLLFVEVYIVQDVGDFLQVDGMVEAEFLQAVDAEGLEVYVPVDAGHFLLQLVEGHLVVAVGRIAKFDCAERSLGEAGLYLHDSLHVPLGVVFIHAEELEEVDDIFLVFLADFLCLGIVVEVIFLFAQRDAALADAHDVGRTVHHVGADIGAEVSGYAFHHHEVHGREYLVLLLDDADSPHVGAYRLHAFAVEAGGIHGDIVEVADFLLDASGSVLGFGSGEGGDDVMELLAVVLTQLVECAEL